MKEEETNVLKVKQCPSKSDKSNKYYQQVEILPSSSAQV